jgi:gamma-glutamyltranspeptidase / glutathione hydrolase
VSNRIPRATQRELEQEGYEVVRSAKTYGFAAVHAIRVHPDGLDGGADPGHDGIAMAV